MNLPDVNVNPNDRAVMETAGMAWESSPSGTVWRKSLYRQGGEYGPVTSVVRYAAEGRFRSHSHPQGEEVLVLEGVFSDEYGDYPAGSYFLNPDGSHHAPFSREGCVLLVRLRQYAGSDRPRLVLDTSAMDWISADEPGIAGKRLYAQPGYPERMHLLKWDAGAKLPSWPGYEEVFVLEGRLQDELGSYPTGTWLRHSRRAYPLTSQDGCIAYVRRIGSG